MHQELMGSENSRVSGLKNPLEGKGLFKLRLKGGGGEWRVRSSKFKAVEEMKYC